jgi:prepilin-type N-terminal cleavage/methylation domain-containing protein
MRKEAGLTLVELLVTIAVLGVLLGIGIPAFGGLAQDNRLSTTTNRLVGALHLTRSEAVRRNARVTICSSADGEYCATEGGWEQGWIVFVDTGATGSAGRAIHCWRLVTRPRTASSSPATPRCNATSRTSDWARRGTPTAACRWVRSPCVRAAPGARS